MKFKSTFIVIVLFACFYSCSVAQMGLYSSTNKKAIKYYEKAITAFNTINPTTGKSDLNEANKVCSTKKIGHTHQPLLPRFDLPEAECLNYSLYKSLQ